MFDRQTWGRFGNLGEWPWVITSYRGSYRWIQVFDFLQSNLHKSAAKLGLKNIIFWNSTNRELKIFKYKCLRPIYILYWYNETFVKSHIWIEVNPLLPSIFNSQNFNIGFAIYPYPLIIITMRKVLVQKLFPFMDSESNILIWIATTTQKSSTLTIKEYFSKAGSLGCSGGN